MITVTRYNHNDNKKLVVSTVNKSSYLCNMIIFSPVQIVIYMSKHICFKKITFEADSSVRCLLLLLITYLCEIVEY